MHWCATINAGAVTISRDEVDDICRTGQQVARVGACGRARSVNCDPATRRSVHPCLETGRFDYAARGDMDIYLPAAKPSRGRGVPRVCVKHARPAVTYLPGVFWSRPTGPPIRDEHDRASEPSHPTRKNGRTT
jgi:hypothetical protein